MGVLLWWFSSCIPLDGSSVTLIAKTSWDLLRGCFFIFISLLLLFLFFHGHALCWIVDNSAIKVEVKRLDYGDTTSLSLWSIKELTPEMATLPLQAVQASLANVSISSPVILLCYFTFLLCRISKIPIKINLIRSFDFTVWWNAKKKFRMNHFDMHRFVRFSRWQKKSFTFHLCCCCMPFLDVSLYLFTLKYGRQWQ